MDSVIQVYLSNFIAGKITRHLLTQSGLETYFLSNSKTFASCLNLNSQIAVTNSQVVLQLFNRFNHSTMYFCWFKCIISEIFQKEKDMCLWNTDAPGGNKVKIWQKSLCPTFWSCPTPRGMWCQWSVRNQWMNLQSKFGYMYFITSQTLNICTLFVSGTELQTDKQINKWTDGRSYY